MEHPPLPRNGGERSPKANSYGTNDPEVRARIEQARREASEQRRRHRTQLEQLVEQGISPDDAEALIEFEHYVRDQRLPSEQAATAIRSEAETTPTYRPRIYVADLVNQRQGVQHGAWIDANQPADGARNWAIEASEEFAGLEVHGFTDTELVTRLARGVAEHGAAYAVFVQIVGTVDRELLERFEYFYVGSYASLVAWAREVGEDLEWDRQLDRVVDPMLRPYVEIDYARFARDQREVWDVVEGVDGRTHVFMR